MACIFCLGGGGWWGGVDDGDAAVGVLGVVVVGRLEMNDCGREVLRVFTEIFPARSCAREVTNLVVVFYVEERWGDIRRQL